MGLTFRRYLPVFLVLSLIAVVLARPDRPVHVYAAPSQECFTVQVPGSCTTPSTVKVVASDISDALPAWADTRVAPPGKHLGDRNGYCVAPSANHVPVGGQQGFSISATPVNAAIPVPLPQAALVTLPVPGPQSGVWGIISTDFDDHGTGALGDDSYCVVILAPPSTAATVTIRWSYTGATGTEVATLVIPIVSVSLRGVNGVVGGAGVICTVGWGPANTGATFLSGADVAANWTIFPPLAGVAIMGSPYPDPDPGHSGEWCISLSSTAAQAAVNVQFRFASIYDKNTTADDRPQLLPPPGDGTLAAHTLSLPTPIRFDVVNFSELRHITPVGQILPLQVSPLMVIGSSAKACIIPSDTLDLLGANAINFNNGTGPDIPNSGNVHIFRAGATGEAPLVGVVPGTLCFSWTSSSPGEQTITLNFFKHDPTPAAGLTTLAAPLSNVATTMTVANPAGFTVGQYVRIDDNLNVELAVVTSIAGNVIGIQRGANATTAIAHGAGVAVVGHGPRQVSWDTNGDGNGNNGQPNGPLVARWARIQSTVITNGRQYDANIVTNGSYPLSVDFNVSNGTFISGAVQLTEWVFGVERTGIRTIIEPLQGATIRAGIDTACGYFATSTLKNLQGPSVGGRLDAIGPDGIADDIDFTITNDPGCQFNSSVHIVVDVFYPNGTTPAAPQETVSYSLQFTPPQSTPIVAWAGQTVTINYAFSFVGSCGLAGSGQTTLAVAMTADPNLATMTVVDPSVFEVGQYIRIEDGASSEIARITSIGINTLGIQRAGRGTVASAHAAGVPVVGLGPTVYFNRSAGQPGNFNPGPGIVLNGASSAESGFNSQCVSSVTYTSPDAGEVDITASVFTTRSDFTKVVFPIFFLEIEDLTLTATNQSVVSTVGALSATVRGWFVGTNPSPRKQETKADGRVLPAKRWILPDDWEQLRGDASSRINWGSPELPALKVTFGMVNEPVINSYANKVSNGDLGWLLPDDGGEFSWNVDPITQATAKLTPYLWSPESEQFPRRAPITEIPPARILSDSTDTAGTTSVDTYGDFNLSYEGCPPNQLTGQPECDQKQVVGHSRYVAWTNLPGPVGKHDPIRSQIATTEWTWGGYKKVEVIDTASPILKYVVVHLRDRDGFCDASGFNNVLGVPIDFLILGRADGKIADMGGSQATLGPDRQSARVTTFDTKDPFDNPLHQDITLNQLQDGECQAWIKVSQSMPEPLRVRITIPATPVPPPGPIRITGLICTPPGDEFVTIKNTGKVPLSLEGFQIRSNGDVYLDPEEYMEPNGMLGPGESRTYPTKSGWLEVRRSDFNVFRNVKTLAPGLDWARLMFNGVEVSRAWCDGRFENPDPLPPVTASGEGDLTFEVVIPFGQQVQLPLVTGWNLISITSGANIADLLAGHEDDVAGLYVWDELKGWQLYVPNSTVAKNQITQVETGDSVWVQVKQPFTLSMLK